MPWRFYFSAFFRTKESGRFFSKNPKLKSETLLDRLLILFKWFREFFTKKKGIYGIKKGNFLSEIFSLAFSGFFVRWFPREKRSEVFLTGTWFLSLSITRLNNYSRTVIISAKKKTSEKILRKKNQRTKKPPKKTAEKISDKKFCTYKNGSSLFDCSNANFITC